MKNNLLYLMILIGAIAGCRNDNMSVKPESSDYFIGTWEIVSNTSTVNENRPPTQLTFNKGGKVDINYSVKGDPAAFSTISWSYTADNILTIKYTSEEKYVVEDKKENSFNLKNINSASYLVLRRK